MERIPEIQAAAPLREKILRRLVRLARQAPPQSIPHGIRRPLLRENPEERRQSKKSPRVEETGHLIEAWAKGRGPTIKAAAAALSRDLAHVPASQIGEAEITQVFEAWRQRYAASTLKGREYAIADFIRNALKRPIPVPHAAVADARTETFTEEEVESMIEHSQGGMKLYILLAYDAGMRSATALSIKATNWNPERQTITFTTKGQRKMTLPASPRLSKMLEAAASVAQPSQPLVEALLGKPATKYAILSQWRKARDTHGVRHELHPHDLRRTMATKIYDQTKDLRAVQQFLGHRSLLATVAYIAPHDPAKLKQILAAALASRKKAST